VPLKRLPQRCSGELVVLVKGRYIVQGEASTVARISLEMLRHCHQLPCRVGVRQQALLLHQSQLAEGRHQPLEHLGRYVWGVVAEELELGSGIGVGDNMD
jgi:hypothetical protein